MGKTKCCNCNKEIGMTSFKFSYSELWDISSHPKVATMSSDDRLCSNCKKLFEDQINQNKVEEIQTRKEVTSEKSIKTIKFEESLNFCLKCRNEMRDNICTNCNPVTNHSIQKNNNTSGIPESMLEFFPIIFGIFGGIFVWHILKNQNPKKAKSLLKIGILFTAIVVGAIIFAFVAGIIFSIEYPPTEEHVSSTKVDFTGSWEGQASGDFVYLSQTGLIHCTYDANFVLEIVQNADKIEGLAFTTDKTTSNDCKDAENLYMSFTFYAIASNSSIIPDSRVGGYDFSATLGNDGVLKGEFSNSLSTPDHIGETSDENGKFTLKYVGENSILVPAS